MEKSIYAGTAKLRVMDKIMDKLWKTLRSFPHLTHNFDHNSQQAFPSKNKLYHKRHNNYCYCLDIFFSNHFGALGEGAGRIPPQPTDISSYADFTIKKFDTTAATGGSAE